MIPRDLPPSAAAERDAVIAEIEAAFADATRDGAVSWRESKVIDDHGSKEERERARRLDNDTDWRQLVDDRGWREYPATGGYVFLDTPGYRYYVPPVLVRMLKGRRVDMNPDDVLQILSPDPREHKNLWSPAHLRAIARFVDFMSRHDEIEGDRLDWWVGLEERWGRELGR